MKRLRGERGASGVAVALLVVAGFAALAVIIFALRWITAEPSGALEQRDQTIGSGDYRIAAYDAFFDDCASAKTLQQNLENAEKSAANEVDPVRKMQLDANVAALSNQLNAAVNEYNADARKADTRGHFLSSDLPYQLDTEGEIACTA